MTFSQILLLTFLAAAGVLHSQPEDCDCLQNDIFGDVGRNLDSTFTIRFPDGSTLDKCVSIVRSQPQSGRLDRQRIKVCFIRAGELLDTVFVLEGCGLELRKFDSDSHTGEYVIPLYPARAYINTCECRFPHSFSEVTPLTGYGGSDESTRSIAGATVGFSELYYGLEILAAPFGEMLGAKFSPAVMAGVTSENGRTRFSVGGQLRYWPWRDDAGTEWLHYIPKACRFYHHRDKNVRRVRDSLEKHPCLERLDFRNEACTDSSVFLVSQCSPPESGTVEPFLFFDGGKVFHSDFEGSGPEPSLNPEDHGELYWGAGIGAVMFKWVSISVAYRYWRWNLRTNCPECEEENYLIVNTNNVHSIIAKMGVFFRW